MNKMIGYPGSLNLSQLQTQIRFHEAGGFALKDCIVSADKLNQPINIFEFVATASGRAPSDTTLVPMGTAGPAGLTRYLTDTVIVSGSFTQVDFYR